MSAMQEEKEERVVAIVNVKVTEAINPTRQVYLRLMVDVELGIACKFIHVTDSIHIDGIRLPSHQVGSCQTEPNGKFSSV